MDVTVKAAPPRESVFDVLSAREMEVLSATALGLTNPQLADRLGVSVHAVKFHLASIYRKLAVANRTEAVVLFVRETGLPAPAEAAAD
jgi:DNA-binding CsgD family transcriptional regulator